MFPKKLTRQVICNRDEPVVQTKDGKLCGRLVEGTYIFRGIKYADAKRFHMPEKVKPWEGVKEAFVYGPVCCETGDTIPHDETMIPHFFYPQDENCQYLNIWTQHMDKGAKKPVMVWIHGGAFSTGSSCEQFAYDGENLSQFGDVVVVSLNHRINLLGFMNLSKYGEQYRYSGNVGFADIVVALQWVRDNIEAFGGDPGNVTLFGQSGGGGKICALLQMPAADGLYHKAIMFSGVIDGKKDITVEDSQKLTDMILEELDIAPAHIEEIERVPYYLLARAASNAGSKLQSELGKGFMWGPVFDGEYYLGHPLQQGFRKETKHIPLITGSVLGEMTHNYAVVLADGSKCDWSEGLKAELRKKRFGADADKILAAFKKAYPERNTADVFFVDKILRKGNIDFTALRAKSGCAPIHCFLFCLESPLNSGTIPWHGAELPYVFHNADHIPASYIPGVSEWLQDMISGACVAFAKTGDPNHVRMPYWPEAKPGCGAVMIFDREPGVRNDHDGELMQLLPDVTMGDVASGRPKPVLGGGPRQSL